MSSSVLVAAQAKFNERMLGAEWKLPDSAAVRVAALGEMANPLFANIRTSESRTVTAKFPIRQAAGNGTVRVPKHNGNNPDSGTETISWTKLVESFQVSLGLADNNLYSFQEMYASAKRNAIYNLLARADASFVTSLQADETTAAADGANGVFGATNDEVVIPFAEKDNFFGEVKHYLYHNQYKGQIVGIVDSKAGALADKLGRDGQSNASNTAAQLLGYAGIVPSTRVNLTGTFAGEGLFFQNGLVGVNFWIPPKNRKTINAAKAMADTVGDFGQFTVPEFPGVTFAHSMYVDRSDESGNGGDEQDIVLNEEVSLEMAYVSAPVSSFHTETSPVFAIGQAAS